MQRTPCPFIQGTDCCGRIVAIGPGGDEGSIDSRVLVRACMRSEGFDSLENIWMASDFDGAFAQYVVVPASEVFPILISYVEADEIRPLVAKTFPLADIATAQAEFLLKNTWVILF